MRTVAGRAGILSLWVVACTASAPAPPDDHQPRPEPPADPGAPPVTAPPPPSDGTGAAQRPASADAIARENARPGTAAWRATKLADRGEIEGYALASSAAPGDAVPIAVSLSAPGTFRWIAYRLGWYGGARGREVARGGPVDGGPQPPCPPATGTGLVACRWTPSFALQTDAAWPSGLYAVKLVRADGFERFVPLVLRPTRGGEVRMVVPTANWQAYNAWGGTSLYDDLPGVTGRGRAVQVSFDRPYARDGGLGHVLRTDLSVVTWLEAQGVDVEYLASEDVDRDPAALRGAKAIVVSGHDEYWTGAQRARVDEAVAAGTSVFNAGANNGYWQVRLEAAADGRARRVVTCWKNDAAALDPVGPASPALTTLFREAPVSRPESALFGVRFEGGWNVFGFAAVISAAATHWALEGTGLATGDAIPLATGDEVDGLALDGTSPAQDVLAVSPMLRVNGGVAAGLMVVRRQGAAWIFSAGGIGFAATLSADGRADPRAQRLAANVLFRMLGRPVPPLVTFGGPPPAPAPDGFARAVVTLATGLGAPSSVALLPGGAFAVADMAGGAVRRVAPDGAVTTLATGLLDPMGLAADADGTLYVSDSRRGVVQRIPPGGAMSVFAGAPFQLGSADGPAALARFVVPAGLAVANGALWVVDSAAGAIRRVDLAAPGHPVTTVPAPGLYRPSAAAVAPDGSLFVVDSGNKRIVRVAGGASTPVAGGAEGFRDGAAAQARLLPQLGIALLPDGALAVADPGNHRLRRIAGGVVTTLAGTGAPGTRDGAGAAASLALPAGVAAGPDGRLYVVDAASGRLRALDP